MFVALRPSTAVRRQAREESPGLTQAVSWLAQLFTKKRSTLLPQLGGLYLLLVTEAIGCRCRPLRAKYCFQITVTYC